MKKGILVLVMIATAATAYNQSSRRTTNANSNTSSRNSTQERVYASTKTPERETKVNSRATSNANQHRNSTRTTSHKHHANNKTYTYQKVNSNKHHHTVHYDYRVPSHVEVVWTADMHRHYVKMYPHHTHWNYHYGCRITSIPANKAAYYIGDVKNVYGRITDVFYSRETDEYILYVGRYYPYQHFTIVVPGNIARRQSHRPGYYYMNQHVRVTGLISTFEGKPEIVVMRNSQINVY